jgi:hypothetical protein
MPLVHGFTSTTIWRAFVLNSLVNSLTIVIALIVKQKFVDRYLATNPGESADYLRVSMIVGVAAFFVSIIAYSLIHLIFGFGLGMTYTPHK